MSQLSRPIGSPNAVPFNLLARHQDQVTFCTELWLHANGSVPPPLELLIAAGCEFIALQLERVMLPRRH